MINLPPTTFPAFFAETLASTTEVARHHEIAGSSSMPISFTNFTTLAANANTYLTVAGTVSVTETEGARP